MTFKFTLLYCAGVEVVMPVALHRHAEFSQQNPPPGPSGNHPDLPRDVGKRPAKARMAPLRGASGKTKG